MPAPATPWQAGRLDGRKRPAELLFGRAYEDSAIEIEAFPPGSRVLCIASAGCTALALCGERAVTAVDINPVQLAYARARAQGEPMRAGAAERFMSLGRRLLALAGWSRSALEGFLRLDEPEAQLAYWRRRLDTARFRLAVDFLLEPRRLKAFYAAPLLAVLPRGFGAALRGRLERCWGRHPNRSNPYARALLLGELVPPAFKAKPIDFVCGDAADYLESCAPGSFDGFALSNILDGTGPAYERRLLSAVRRAARPGAILVRRSFAAAHSPAQEELAAKDRSALWGLVEIREAA